MGNNFLMKAGRTKVANAKVAGAVLMAMGAAFLSSKPALAGPSGLSNYPSTDIYTKGNFHFDADFYFSGSGKVQTGQLFGLEYGLAPDTDKAFGRTEFGIDYLTSDFANANSFNRLVFNAKTQLFANSEAGTRVVAGVYGVGSKRIGASNTVFLTGSKSFGNSGRVHVGVAQTLQSRSVFPSNRTRLQLGYDKQISKQLIFAADFQTGETEFFAPGLIYVLNDKAGIQVSYLRGGSAVAPRNQIYFGFDYNFGGAPATAPDAPAGDGGAGGGGGGGGGGG